MAEQNVAVVAGGAGGIGEGVVHALKREGFHVVVPIREGDREGRLKDYVSQIPSGNLSTVAADLSNEADVARLLQEALGVSGRIDAVVVSVGAYYYGYSLHRMPFDDWLGTVRDNLRTHYLLQRYLLDQMHIQGSGVYVTLTGPEADAVIPDAGTMSIMAAAQKMMARVMAYEAFGTPVRVHVITAQTSILTRSRGEQAGTDWITSQDLGEYVCALIGGNSPGTGDVIHELRNRDHLRRLLRLI